MKPQSMCRISPSPGKHTRERLERHASGVLARQDDCQHPRCRRLLATLPRHKRCCWRWSHPVRDSAYATLKCRRGMPPIGSQVQQNEQQQMYGAQRYSDGLLAHMT